MASTRKSTRKKRKQAKEKRERAGKREETIKGEKAAKPAAKEQKAGEESPADENKCGRNYEKQILFVVGLMVFILAAFFIFFFIFKNAGNFVYEGIKFQKTTLGDSRIPMYRGEIFITRPDARVKLNLYLRNDPRSLENINVDIPSLALYRFGYISFQPEISGCFGSSYASFRLAEFLSALGMTVKGATTDPVLSAEQNIEWRTCEDAKKSNLTVIVLQNSEGNETTIQQDGNCYIINISSCEVIPAAEKFVLESAVALVNRYDKNRKQ